jgi:hypothetical protein
MIASSRHADVGIDDREIGRYQDVVELQGRQAGNAVVRPGTDEASTRE